MRRTVNKIIVLCLTTLIGVSCMVESGSSSSRSKYSLMDYSESTLGRIYVFEPVLAVVLARTADEYLSLSEADREDFDVTSIFPDGIRHIDPNSIYAEGDGWIYSDGTSIDVQGAKWTVRLTEPAVYKWYDYSFTNSWYYERSSSDTEVQCTGDGAWTVFPEEANSNGFFVRDGGITVTLVSETAEGAVYKVETEGGEKASEGLVAYCRSGDEGIEVKYTAPTGTSSGDSSGASDGTSSGDSSGTSDGTSSGDSGSDGSQGRKRARLTPVLGLFYVDFERNQEAVDYCVITYSAGGTIYEVSVD